MNFSTRAIHVGQEADPATGATIVPIYQTSTYTQEEIGKDKGYQYSRTGNPTRAALEKCLASLENGKHGLAFASGLAAASAVLSLLRPGDHIVSAEDLYGGTFRLFEKVYLPQQIAYTLVDGRRPEEFGKAIRKETKLVWIESPTNPLLHLVDIEAVAQISHERGILLAVDNTFATPYLQKPLTLGADVVIHSTTKYIGGHSDVIGGAVITDSDAIFQQVKFYQNAVGAVPGPFDSWLTLRGIKTLALRMRQHSENAQKIAEYLAGHPKVKKVYYPGLPKHPQHSLAERQMSDFGGMVSFEIGGGRDVANSFFKALNIFSYAESLGAVESLACYPVVMTHGSIPREERERRGINEGVIRLSVGIEDIQDLIEDIRQALTACRADCKG